ncbi:nitroreductase family protein [Desulfovibrio legallii]|jgi:hypothetical protein|uniref:Nitroreductase n=1 Tax=Desulfovibrio legallii TaxID=571438 RepID=A0A1G7P9C8_9BACT|nr:nitroreductase family protein [Desulfovibrio legallii]SDF82902.1 Nitroreductase [Desulfovibrio legallii]
MVFRLRQTLSLLLSLAALALLPSAPVRAADGAAPRLELPAPDKSGGLPLMQALAQRRSTKRGFSGAPLPPQQLSDLLWATWGVNRADGRRTAPSAMNRQEVEVFVALPDGVWRYDPAHILVRVLEGDKRGAMGGGSLTLLYAAPAASQWSGMHVGSLYQNAGLYCASVGLGSYVHASGLHALDGQLPLPEGWRVLIVQTVGVTQ